MPYAVEKRGEKWACVNSESGKVFGEHDSEAEAMAQMRALHVHAPPDKERKDGRITVRRFDVLERLDGPTVLPNGWLKADAAIARAGIQSYRRGDGSVRREFRPPEEVFDSAAMASFAMVPVTDNHPADGLLTAENTREYQRGHLGETVRRDGDKVRATVLVTDADLVKRVLAGKQQLSAGYVCDLEDAPGEYQGERYDCVQRSVKGNHVAVVDVARGGPELRLKLDAADGEALPLDLREDPAIRGDREGNAPPERRTSAREHPMVKVKIDGIEVEVANEQAAQLIERALATQRERADAAEKAVKQVRTDAEQAATQAKSDTEAFRARATVAESKVSELEKTRKDAQDALPGMVKARVALEEKAKAILGAEAKLDELSDRKIKEAVAVKLLPDLKLDGEPDAYVEAVYRGALASQEKSAAKRGLSEARRAAGDPPGRQDAEEHLDADEIRKRNMKTTEDAWKKPSVGVTA
jgi:hypothetical protein